MSLDSDIGDIIDVVKTNNVDKTNEYMVLANQGLFFINISIIKNPKKGTTQFEF